MKLNRSGKNRKLTKLLVAIILAAALTVTLLGKKSYRWGLEEGDVSSSDIYAPFDFSYVDEKATVELKAQRADEVKPVYNLMVFVDATQFDSMPDDEKGQYATCGWQMAVPVSGLPLDATKIAAGLK